MLGILNSRPWTKIIILGVMGKPPNPHDFLFFLFNPLKKPLWKIAKRSIKFRAKLKIIKEVSNLNELDYTSRLSLDDRLNTIKINLIAYSTYIKSYGALSFNKRNI